MTAKLTISLGIPGQNLRALIQSPDGLQRWNGTVLVDGSTISSTDWSTGLVAMTELLTSDSVGRGDYSADLPLALEGQPLFVKYYESSAAGPGDPFLGYQVLGEVEALLDYPNGVEAGKTIRQTLQIMAAILAGKVSGAGSGTETFRSLDDSADRVVVTADASGNRTAVEYGS
jgi:hypothetical protein